MLRRPAEPAIKRLIYLAELLGLRRPHRRLSWSGQSAPWLQPIILDLHQ